MQDSQENQAFSNENDTSKSDHLEPTLAPKTLGLVGSGPIVRDPNQTIITFNFSVTHKAELSRYPEPFQVMPCTIQYLTQKMVDNYAPGFNPNTIIHMSYVIKPFGNKLRVTKEGSEKTNSELFTEIFRNYALLASKLGTKNILIHLPESETEFKNLNDGLHLIYEAFKGLDVIIHFEQPSWSKDFQKYIRIITRDPSNVQQHRPTEKMDLYYNTYYLNACLAHIKSIFSVSSNPLQFRLVLDTAHLFANGLNVEEMIQLLKMYNSHIDFIHLNGNLNEMYKSDSHVPIYLHQNKFLNEVPILMEYLVSTHKICIAELTKQETGAWPWWCDFCKESKVHLVRYHKAFGIPK
jgi:hypothetical protein